MPQVTIDGKQLEFSPGETIIQVATRSAIEIAYYCWHPRLSVAANCRMCLVEVEKQPKLVPACQTACAEGMVVATKNDKVKAAQKSVSEFLLLNHPIDCPICDQAGECKLQDYYMKFQLTSSRMVDEKGHKPRHEALGPHVMYNGERCIMCTRCVRFMDEIAGQRQLAVLNRGDHAEIGIMEGQPLDNPYSMNVVDICPVGALTSIPFRFKQRVWFMKRADSLCGGCARGCNVHLDHRAGQVYRMLPRENRDVNDLWMCDDGRLTYTRANDRRLEHPLLRPRASGAVAETVEAEQALRVAAELLKPIAAAKQGLLGALSLHATCEEAYVFGALVRDVLRAEAVALLEYAPGLDDKLLRVADRNPNRAGITRVLAAMGIKTLDETAMFGRLASGGIKALIALGHETTALGPLADAAQRCEVVVHLSPTRTAIAEVADVTLPTLPWVQVDGTWVNVANRAQRLMPAFPPTAGQRTAQEWLVALAARLGAPLALGSPASIRAELERELGAFKGARLNDLGALGHPLPAL